MRKYTKVCFTLGGKYLEGRAHFACEDDVIYTHHVQMQRPSGTWKDVTAWVTELQLDDMARDFAKNHLSRIIWQSEYDKGDAYY